MRAVYAKAELESLLDPESGPWRAQASESIQLIGTPAGMQPTEAIRVSWTGKTIGAVTSVRVAAIHNGDVLAFRLDWDDPNEDAEVLDNDTFPDAAAIALPAAEDAPLVLMGAAGKPINAWYWRADEADRARHVTAEGLGTSRTLDVNLVKARGIWKEGRWQVVIARAMNIAVPGAAQITPGSDTGFGVAIWEGSHKERAGIKAFSGDWKVLTIDPTDAGGTA
jgi:DMSO reductase family type II enzyme heme b subunit